MDSEKDRARTIRSSDRFLYMMLEGLRVVRDEPEVEDLVSVVRQELSGTLLVLSICIKTVSNNSLVKFLH